VIAENLPLSLEQKPQASTSGQVSFSRGGRSLVRGPAHASSAPVSSTRARTGPLASKSSIAALEGEEALARRILSENAVEAGTMVMADSGLYRYTNFRMAIDAGADALFRMG
jgi:hypothetical protein